ncbi:hypothetical protein QJ48_21050 [Paenibacillus sp. A3]|nr:hypothetical protein QJ48_21050 [Paenibacillus sp. A3]
MTAEAEFLRTDAPQSLRSTVLMITDKAWWRPTQDRLQYMNLGLWAILASRLLLYLDTSPNFIFIA